MRGGSAPRESLDGIASCAADPLLDLAQLNELSQQWIITVVFLIVGLWSDAPSEVVLGLFLVFSFLNAINGALTSIYPGEVFPTEVRGLGTGFAAAVSRIGAGLGTFLLPITIEKFGVEWTILGMAVIVFQRSTGVSAVGSGDQGDEPFRDRPPVFALARRRLCPQVGSRQTGVAAAKQTLRPLHLDSLQQADPSARKAN